MKCVEHSVSAFCAGNQQRNVLDTKLVCSAHAISAMSLLLQRGHIRALQVYIIIIIIIIIINIMSAMKYLEQSVSAVCTANQPRNIQNTQPTFSQSQQRTDWKKIGSIEEPLLQTVKQMEGSREKPE